MSRLEDLLRETLTAHEDEAPTGAGLLPAVHARTARRRRFAWTAGALTAAAAVALIAVLAVVLPGHGGSPPTTFASPQPSVTAAPAGMRWVSYHGAQLQVPDAWKVNDAVCGTPQHDTVMVEDGGPVLDCLVPQPAGLTVVRMTPADTPLGKARAALATAPVTVDGQPARRGDGTPDRQRGPLQVLVLPSVNVVISVESPNQSQAKRILDSVRLAVPVDAYGCRPQVDSLIPPVSGAAGHPETLAVGHPVGASLCWYRDGWLSRSVRLDPGEVDRLVSTLRALPASDGGPTPAATVGACEETNSGFLVQLTDEAGSTSDVYVHIACQHPYAATGAYVAQVSNALVRFLTTQTGYSGQVPDPSTLP